MVWHCKNLGLEIIFNQAQQEEPLSGYYQVQSIMDVASPLVSSVILSNADLIDLKKKLTCLESCVHCQQNKLPPIIAMDVVWFAFYDPSDIGSPFINALQVTVWEAVLRMQESIKCGSGSFYWAWSF